MLRPTTTACRDTSSTSTGLRRRPPPRPRSRSRASSARRHTSSEWRLSTPPATCPPAHSGPARLRPAPVRAASSPHTASTKEQAPIANDASGNGHFGEISGATWASGRYGGALSFDGSNDSVLLGSLGTFYQSGFTLEAWVNKTSATENDAAVVGTWTGSGPMIWVDHLATRYHLTLGGGYSGYLDSGQSPLAGQWQHLAATYDGTTRPLLHRRRPGRLADQWQRGQLRPVADRRLRRLPGRLLRRADRRRPRSTTTR